MFRQAIITARGIARHLLVVLAVLATVAVACGLHAHADDGHGAALVTKFDLGDGALFSDHGHPPASDTDPDGCGGCHCPEAASDLPHVLALLLPVAGGQKLPTAGPDYGCGIAFQPDPPPIRG